MMYEFSIENEYGEKICLTDSKKADCYQIDGICPPSALLNFTDIAGRNGGIYNSGRIQKRNIVAYLKLYPDVEENRNFLYGFLCPNTKVRCYFKNGIHNVYIDGYVETCDVTPFTNNEIIQTSIICPNPYWNDVEEEIISFSDVNNGFEFPFSAPEDGLVLGEINKITSKMIQAGGVGGGFIFELHMNGAVENPKLYNLTTNTFCGFSTDRIKLNSGDVISVNTQMGEKNAYLIRLYQKTNLIGAMLEGASFVQLVPGDNHLTIEADSGIENIEVLIKFRKHWLGV